MGGKGELYGRVENISDRGESLGGRVNTWIVVVKILIDLTPLWLDIMLRRSL